MSGRIFLLFFPACLGLLGQTINHAAPDRGWADGQSLLALALLLLAIDQARMAAVDLTQVAAIRAQPLDQRLEQFYRITLSTILFELLGFYGAIGNLGVGAAVVLLSQIWFNLLANIQLQPETEEPIRAWGIADRLPMGWG
jgi:hypothetical protein